MAKRGDVGMNPLPGSGHRRLDVLEPSIPSTFERLEHGGDIIIRSECPFCGELARVLGIKSRIAGNLGYVIACQSTGKFFSTYFPAANTP